MCGARLLMALFLNINDSIKPITLIPFQKKRWRRIFNFLLLHCFFDVFCYYNASVFCCQAFFMLRIIPYITPAIEQTPIVWYTCPNQYFGGMYMSALKKPVPQEGGLYTYAD